MWPAGTVLYEVAPAEVHAAAANALRAASAKVQRGCLHIRVSADIQVQDFYSINHTERSCHESFSDMGGSDRPWLALLFHSPDAEHIDLRATAPKAFVNAALADRELAKHHDCCRQHTAPAAASLSFEMLHK